MKSSKASERYGTLSTERSPYLNSAEEYARLSIPAVLPEEDGTRGAGSNQTDFDSIGAQLVSNLANKLVNTLFPTRTSFFALILSPRLTQELSEGGKDISKEVDPMLSGVVANAKREQDSINYRMAFIQAAKSLLVTGNSLLHWNAVSKSFNAIPLNCYCQRFNNDNQLVELVIRKKKTFDSFPSNVRDIVSSKCHSQKKGDDVVTYYVHAVLENGTYTITHTIEDVICKTIENVPYEIFPYISLCHSRDWNANYGRGMVEENAGDFYTVNFLSGAIIKGMALMADIKYLIKQGSTIDINEFMSSPTGEAFTGNIDDIGVLQLEKYADFSPLSSVLEKYERRLGQTFLDSLASSIESSEIVPAGQP